MHSDVEEMVQSPSAEEVAETLLSMHISGVCPTKTGEMKRVILHSLLLVSFLSYCSFLELFTLFPLLSISFLGSDCVQYAVIARIFCRFHRAGSRGPRGGRPESVFA